MSLAEALKRPDRKSSIPTIYNWFKNQPTFLPEVNIRTIPSREKGPEASLVYANIYTPRYASDGQPVLPEEQQVCHVILEQSPSMNYRIFDIRMILDKKGRPLRLWDSCFYAFARANDKVYFLTYSDRKGSRGVAELSDIQEEGLPDNDRKKMDPAAELELIKYFKEQGYFTVVDYVRTIKAAMLARKAESLEIPFKEPKTNFEPQYLYTKPELIPSISSISKLEAQLSAQIKGEEISARRSSMIVTSGRA